MAEKSTGRQEDESKEPFVPPEDRPEVRISLDTPLSELRVRELSAILGLVSGKNPNFEVGKTSIKDFFDKDWPEIAKDWVKESKGEKFEKNEKLEKDEKLEKNEKWEKREKIEKPEKLEKPEFKEIKIEKVESDGVLEPRFPHSPDPRFEQIVEVVGQLTKQVSQLADQVEQLRKGRQG